MNTRLKHRLFLLTFIAISYSNLAHAQFDINTLLGGSSQNLLSNFLKGGSSGGTNQFQDIIKNLFNSQSSPAAAQSFCDERGSSSGDSNIDEELDENCRREHLDIMFIVDGSGSVGESNFDKVKNFLNLVVDTTEVGRDASRIGLIQFSTEPKTEFSFNAHTSNSAVKGAISAMKYERGGTYIGKALQYALEKELIASKGDRADKKTVIIVITDGESSDDPKNSAERLRQKGFSTLAIGVEPQSPFGIFTFGFKTSLNNEQLLSVAGDPDRVFRVCDFNKLDNDFKNALAAQICTESEICKNSYSDLILVVDGSGSIGAGNFVKVKTFLNLLVGAVNIGRDKTRVGIVQFNDDVKTEFHLDRYTTKESLMKAIEEIGWMRGKTRVGRALTHVANDMLGKNGDRPGVSDVVLVLTDGQSSDDVKGPAEALRARGATTFALGITDNIDKVQLADIAGSPGREFEVKNFENLDRRLKNAITSKICGEEEKVTTTPATTTRATTRNPSEAAVAGLKLLGCYEDRGDRVFKTEAAPGSGYDAQQTPRKCHDKCKALGKELSGVELHYYCFCGSRADLKTTNKLDYKTRCNTYCVGEPSVMCGGSWTLSVYEDANAPETTTTRSTTGSGRVTTDSGRTTKKIKEGDCEAEPTDVIFVVDGSSSIQNDNFKKIKDFLGNIIQGADIGQDASQFSVVQFNDDPKTEFSLNTHTTKSSLMNAVKNIQWMEGETSVARALRHVNKVELSRTRGWRSQGETVVLVITDGRSNDNPRRAAGELRRRGVKTLAIGITDRIDMRQLKSIAGAKKRMFVVKEFTDLNQNLQTRLADQVCGFGPLGPLVNRKEKKSEEKGRKEKCQMDLAIGVDGSLRSSSSFYRTVYQVMTAMKKKGSKFSLFRANEGDPLLEVLHDFSDSQANNKLRKELRTAHSKRLSRNAEEWDRFRDSLEDDLLDGTRVPGVLLIVGRFGVTQGVADELAYLDQAGVPVFIIKTTRGDVSDTLQSQIELITDSAEGRFLDRPKRAEIIDMLQCVAPINFETDS